MNATTRLALSATIATLFYGGWSYFANAMVTDDQAILIRSAFVQGVYSGTITLLFTFLLEKTHAKVGFRFISIAFVVPLICLAHHRSSHAGLIRNAFNTVIAQFANQFRGICWPAVVFSPLIPLGVQTLLVIAVNFINQTPNLLLTVAPSILFSGIYGYIYTLALYKKQHSGALSAENLT